MLGTPSIQSNNGFRLQGLGPKGPSGDPFKPLGVPSVQSKNDAACIVYAHGFLQGDLIRPCTGSPAFKLKLDSACMGFPAPLPLLSCFPCALSLRPLSFLSRSSFAPSRFSPLSLTLVPLPSRLFVTHCMWDCCFHSGATVSTELL